MLRLCLLRHMKTSWALPGQRDIDRTLNEVGNSDLPIVRDWITRHDLTPGTIYCSTAQRTRQTLAGIQSAFSSEPKTEFRPEMYSGFTDEYLACITGHEKPEALMLIGHNPTCASLANILVSTGDSESLDTLSYKYPTGAMAVLDFEIDCWSKLKSASGNLAAFLMPKPFRKY